MDYPVLAGCGLTRSDAAKVLPPVLLVCQRGCKRSANPLQKVWSGSDKFLKLMSNWLNGIKIRRIWWVGEEGNLIVGEPCLCQFCSMTGCAILLENYSRPLQFYLIIKTLGVSIENLRNVPLFVHPSSLSPWVFQHNNQPLFPKHDSCLYYGLDI